MQYSVVNSPEAVTQAATLGEEMLDKLPPGEFSKEVGWQAFNELRRIGQWAKSTVVGTKLLQKGLGGDPESQRYLHSLLAENYGNIGQHANAAQSLAQVRAIRDDQISHYYHIYRLFHGAAKPAELNGIVQE